MFLSLGRMNWIFLPKSHLTLMSFCDFAIGFAQNDRVEGMLRKIKKSPGWIGTRKFRINLICNSFSKILRLNEIFVIY